MISCLICCHKKQDIEPLPEMIHILCRRLAMLAAALVSALFGLMPDEARAHPHVFVTAESQILYTIEGNVTGIRHRWVFDEAYSAFAVQGLDKNNDGKITPDELADLAKLNVESLHEFGFFTVARANGKKQAFAQPEDYSLNLENKTLALTFTLPLKIPAAAQKSFGLEVFDETYFVSFAWAEGDKPVNLASSPAGCVLTLTRPKTASVASPPTLSEDFFTSQSGQNFGIQFANKALVVCP